MGVGVALFADPGVEDFAGFDDLGVEEALFSGFRVRGLGFGVWGLGFGVWGLGVGVRGSGFGVWGLGFGVWGLGVGEWGVEWVLSVASFRFSACFRFRI